MEIVLEERAVSRKGNVEILIKAETVSEKKFCGQ